MIGTGIDVLYDLGLSGILKCKFITYTDVPCCVNYSGQVFFIVTFVLGFDVTQQLFPLNSTIELSVSINQTVEGYCCDPGTPVNGRRSISGLTKGHTVAYTCNTGYELSGSATRTCQFNGSWSGSSATCPRKYFCICQLYND